MTMIFPNSQEFAKQNQLTRQAVQEQGDRTVESLSVLGKAQHVSGEGLKIDLKKIPGANVAIEKFSADAQKKAKEKTGRIKTC